MGNDQPKAVKINKNQVDVASTKAKIHLELVRDRKNQEIIKGEKQLVNRLKSNSRNKTEEALLMQRIVNGLKYSQAANQLMAYAASLKGQSAYISENANNRQKLEPWLTPIYSLLYAADQLGLSSLNEFKAVMRGLNNPKDAETYTSPQIKQMLTPSPTPYQVNVYVLEMCERNNIELELVNLVGHKFVKNPIPDSQHSNSNFTDIEKQLAGQFQKNFQADKTNGMKSQGNSFNSNQGFGGNQGYGGNGSGSGNGNQGYGNNPGGFGGNNPGGFGGNNPGGFGNNPGGLGGKNPYEGVSTINQGPGYYSPSEIRPKGSQIGQPKQFSSYDSLLKDSHSNEKPVQPVYPQINPNYQPQPYKPSSYKQEKGDEQSESNSKSPTISQIMRDFDVK